MMAREGFVHDAGKHLATDLTEVLRRHASLIRAGGGSPIEMSAAILDAANTYNLAAIGIVLLLVDEDARKVAFREIVEKLADHLRENAVYVTQALAATEQRVGRGA